MIFPCSYKENPLSAKGLQRYLTATPLLWGTDREADHACPGQYDIQHIQYLKKTPGLSKQPGASGASEAPATSGLPD